MAHITVDDILEATGGEVIAENGTSFSGVSIDSRTIGAGDLFIAIRGEHFDGHDFLEQALVEGSGAIVQMRPPALPRGRVVVCVQDTLRSLQELAHFFRMKQDIPVVAVTGSNGKTTTKEMIHCVVSTRFRAVKNEGNLNNHIGLPLSLMQLEPGHEVIVLEMGMNASGEIRRLCEIAVPSHGVITNIGSAHVGRLGSYEAVRGAKLEILEGLKTAVLNGDDEFLMAGFREIREFSGRLLTFAMKGPADVYASHVRYTDEGSRFTLHIRGGGNADVSLNVHGDFNVSNALAAAAVGHSLGIGIQEIASGLAAYKGCPMRFEVIKKGRITIINDSYNANPSSMRESLKELVRLAGTGRAIAVLGDMRELSAFSKEEHRDLGRLIARSGAAVFVAVGARMAAAADESLKASDGKNGPAVFTFRDADEARKSIMSILKEGDTVLIKGSRSMAMERVIEGIGHAL
ncbi:MAG: UDP-N-acetylmuramoyl-tripeptide--D-alanyl-D-alanine ligase [Nitrospiraceae bacterium]|nr:MAG: UDP-N-acetylmuramoyl-tripeptide--D-alanyl-D-alanine ligase [Nitrospiraceae bacterium]